MANILEDSFADDIFMLLQITKPMLWCHNFVFLSYVLCEFIASYMVSAAFLVKAVYFIFMDNRQNIINYIIQSS